MRRESWEACRLIFILAGASASGLGEAWRVLPYSKVDYWDHPSWPRLDSSAFEVRTISGVGRLVPFSGTTETAAKGTEKARPTETDSPRGPDASSLRNAEGKKDPGLGEEEGFSKDSLHDEKNHQGDFDPDGVENAPGSRIVMRILQSENQEQPMMKVPLESLMKIPLEPLDKAPMEPFRVNSRVRREAENETKMEKIATSKTVREVRQNSPESWSTQPLSVEFRHRVGLDQIIQAEEEDYPTAAIRGHHAPRADFVTSHYRRSYDNRESRDMPVSRSYDDYDFPWYRNAIRDREYGPSSYRRSSGYYYPDRYRTERDYYSREPSYYYDRYREEDFDLYGRSRPTPKPKRIIYYATLPEVVRKPVDLRNYPRGYDSLTRTPTSRDDSYKRVPGNVDPSRYRYRHYLDGYDSYSKRSSYYDRPYGYSPEDDVRRKGQFKENPRGEGFEGSEKKVANQVLVRDDGKLPWPVQIGTEVSVKDDDRIPGRKIFGESSGYERFQNAQLQKAPDATGSSELQSDN